jgi:hypothetical protein
MDTNGLARHGGRCRWRTVRPAGKRTANNGLAQDLASFAVDGGLPVIGVEDHNSRAGKVCGVDLAKLLRAGEVLPSPE